jgi:hypothetical protein
MLPKDKVRESISEIQMDFNTEQINEERMMSVFKAMKLSESFSVFNDVKKYGYTFKQVLSLLISMVMMSCKTVNSSLPKLKEHGYTLGKDVYYRLKNNPTIGWRRLLWYISMKFIKLTESNNSEEDNKKPRYLIFDDTTIAKTGKKMEFIGKVYDHVVHRTVLGYKLLVMLYWDGKSSIPLDFSIHREKGQNESKPYGMTKKEQRRQFSKKRIKECESHKRIEELDTSKIYMMIKMLYAAVFHGLRIDYVLCDSWFSCEALIKSVIDCGTHLIGMYKFATTRFLYKGKMVTYKAINAMISKTHYCRTSKLYYKRAEVFYNGIPVTLFFSRMGLNGGWKVFITTDRNLSFKKLIEHYQVRWTIEVFFKEEKGLLNLGGCESNNFDAHIADATVSMITYILLSFRYRFEHYESKGELFRVMNANYLRMTLDKRLWELFIEVIRMMAVDLNIDPVDLLKIVMTNPKAEKYLNCCFETELENTG